MVVHEDQRGGIEMTREIKAAAEGAGIAIHDHL